jgi:hypothetical protein
VTLSNTEISYVIAVACMLAGTAAYIGWILVPAWKSYTRVWERVAASFLTLYVAAAFCGVGILGGATLFYFWDQISPS